MSRPSFQGEPPTARLENLRLFKKPISCLVGEVLNTKHAVPGKDLWGVE